VVIFRLIVGFPRLTNIIKEMSKLGLYFSFCDEVSYFLSVTDDWASRHRWTKKDFKERSEELRNQMSEKLANLAPKHKPLAEEEISKAIEEMETYIND
jgi:thiamine kinase-like enzyme